MNNQRRQLSEALATSRRYFDTAIAEHGWGGLEGSPAAHDAEAVGHQSGPSGSWSQDLLTGTIGYSCLYLFAAARQVSGLGKLFLSAENDELAITAPVLIRSTLEHLANASWILDPRVENARIRVARGQIEGIISGREWYGVASLFPHSESHKHDRALKLREAQAARLFHEREIKRTKHGRIVELAGQNRLYPDEKIKEFGIIVGDGAFGKGIYKYLSAAAHPTAHAIQELLVATTRPDGRKDYQVGVAKDDEYFARLAAPAALGLHQAMRLLASYSGWPIEPLDVWLDELRPVLSTVIAES